MRQRFLLDPPIWPVYLALSILGCYPAAPGLVVPISAGPATAQEVGIWVASSIPSSHTLHRFKWLYRNERSSAGGRGSVRVAPPDSLRFDVAGPLGVRAASAVVVGDTSLWVRPPDAISSLVPSYPLLWAMFGVARPPLEGETLRGLSDERLIAWQYSGATDTVSYARTIGASPTFTAEVRRAGKVVGRVQTKLDANGRPVSSRLLVSSAPARLDITFVSTVEQQGFPADVWAPGRP